MKPKFGPGDKVFAKVRGYPPWPARVEGLADETPNRMKYHIYFYGTGETAVVKAEDICAFVANRSRLGKPKKHKNFTDALVQIEADLSAAEKATLELQQAEIENEDSHDDSTASARRSSTSSKSGKLASPAKNREKKRKLEADSVSSDESDLRKGRPSNSSALDGDSFNKVSPEVMSRSGRKIKPKRFADFDDTPPPPEDSPVVQNRPPLKPFSHKPKVVLKTDLMDKMLETPTKVSDIEQALSEDFVVAEVNDVKVEIPLKLNRPSTGDPKTLGIWDNMVLKYALSLKKQLEAGQELSEPVEKHMENWTKTKVKSFEAAQEDRDQKIGLLKIETQLLDYDTRIKSSLSLNKADPDKCLQLMNEVLELNISPLMLKKHPEVVETVKKMRKYVGNVGQWSMSEAELHTFNSKAAMIRSKSEHVYNKFKAMFLVPNGKSFWEIFAKELDAFNKKTENMTMEAVFSMVQEPE